MAAITWKNPTGANLTAPKLDNPLSGMFSGLTGAVNQYQTQQTDAINRGREDNYNAYLSELDKVTTPDQMTERKDFLANMMGSFDAETQAKLRGANESRFDYLTTRSDQDYTRSRLMENRAAEGTIADMNKYSLNGDATSAKQQVDFLPPALQANALRQINTDQLALSTQKRNLSQQALLDADAALKRGDSNEDRLINNLTATTAKQYSDSILSGRKTLGTLAVANGLPVDDATGAPNVTGMTPEQLTKLTELSKANKLPAWETLFTGDTKQRDSFLQSLGTNSGVTPAGIQRNRAAIDGAFNTLGISKKIGVDQFGVDRANAQADIVQEDKDKNIWLPSGSANAANGFNDLFDNAEKYMDMESGYDQKEDIGPMKDFIARMGREGITAPDGSKWIPSAKDMKAAIGTAAGGYYRDAKRSERAEKYLQDLLKGKSMTIIRQEAEESEKYNRSRRLREKLFPTTK